MLKETVDVPTVKKKDTITYKREVVLLHVSASFGHIQGGILLHLTTAQ
jgi:hypothetical protein